MRRLALALLAAGCLLAANGCKKDVPEGGGGSTTLPDGFPKDVPLPADAQIVSAGLAPAGFSVTLQSKESVDALVKSCSAALESEGWERLPAVGANVGDSIMLAFAKGKGSRTASLMVSKGDKGSQVMMTVVDGSAPSAAPGN